MKTQNESAEQLCTLGKIITFNGQGLSGKSTLSCRIAKLDKEKYKHFHSHTLRRKFRDEIYKEFGGMDTCIKYLDESGTCKKLYEVEVLGFASLAWLTTYFHKEVKPSQADYTVVLDHYIGDFYVDMLIGYDPDKFQNFVKDHLGIPHFKQGIHFYLDIDYETYQNRWEKDKEKHPRDLEVNEKDFEARRGRYKELCDKGYLEFIDAVDMSDLSPEESVKKVAEEIRKKYLSE